MVSVKRIIFTFSVLFVFCGTDFVYARNETVMKPITECEGYSESRTMCERSLPDGTKQTGYGWCKCSGGMLSGGCSLSEYTYTDRMLSLSGGNKCRTCTVPAVTKGCGGMADMVVDETPSCGEWSSCGDSPAGEFCISKDVEFRADPEDDCGTQERKCCDNNIWSEWGKDCPAGCFDKSPCSSDADCCDGKTCQIKGTGRIRECAFGAVSSSCSLSSRPTCTLTGGKCSYSCTCTDGEWTNCRKLQSCNAGYDTVQGTNGICCQKSDGSGPRCANGNIKLDYGWVYQTGSYSCNTAVRGTSPDTACGTCTESTKGWECPIRPNGSTGNWDCVLYTCQFGGGTKVEL